jgi:hypothetical protein
VGSVRGQGGYRLRPRLRRPEVLPGIGTGPEVRSGFRGGISREDGEDVPEDEALFRDLWDDEGERERVLTILQAECEVLPGMPEDYFPY